MRKHFLITLALSLATSTAYASYTGRVFVDKNRNHLWDKGDTPLQGVKVSDGLNVVETASDGTYTLPGHARERFIFITTPSGYKTSNRYYLPIEGTERSYDFSLQPYNPGVRKDGSHLFIQVADTEIFNTINQEDWIGNIRDYAQNERAAFIVHTGDICYEKGLRQHIRLMNTDNMGVPVFYGIGNHDLVKGKYGEELFESIYGPVYYSFEVGGVHYLMTPMPEGDHRPEYTADDVCNWLRNDLAHVKPGTPIVLFNHTLLTYDNTFIYKGSGENSVDLSKHNLKAWLYGHWHIHYKKKQGNVYTIGTSSLDKGGIDHSTTAFRVVHVGVQGEVSTELRYTYLDRHIQVAAPQGSVNSRTITVNTYSSASPTAMVEYTCLENGRTLVPYRKLQASTDWTWTGKMPLRETDKGKLLTVRVRTHFKDGSMAETDSKFVYEKGTAEAIFGKDWTNLVGNATHTAIADTLKGKLQLAWTQNIGANIYMSSPLIYKGKVYTASVDEDLKGQAFVCALNGKDGRRVWKCPVRNSVKNTIAITDETLFAQDVEGHLYAIDVETGQLRWERQLPTMALPALVDGLAANKGIVYAGSGRALSAFEAKTGKLLWRNEDWTQGEGTTSTLSASKDVLIGSAQWGALYGNDIQTGQKLWSISEQGLSNRGASAAIHGSLIYIISSNNFFILEAQTGQIVVRKQLPYKLDVTSTPLVTEKAIVFGTADKGIVALDCQTLEEKWNSPVGNALIYTSPYTRLPAETVETSPVLSGSTVYVGASDGVVYAIDSENGTILWKHATGAPIFSSPAISGNTLVITDFGGNIYAFCSAH